MGVLDKIKGKLGHKGHKKAKSRSRRDLSHKNNNLKERSGSRAGSTSGRTPGNPASGKGPAPDSSFNAPPGQKRGAAGSKDLSAGNKRRPGSKAGQSPSSSRKPSRRGSLKNPGDLKIPDAPQPDQVGSKGRLRGGGTSGQQSPRSESRFADDNSRPALDQGPEQGGRRAGPDSPAQTGNKNDRLNSQLEEIISQNETMIDLLKRIRQSLRSRER